MGSVNQPVAFFKPIRLGLEFDTDDQAYEYYNDYAKEIGFSIRKEYFNKNEAKGYVTSRLLTCYKEGCRVGDKRDSLVKKHRKETRTGCLAHIKVKRQPNGKYRIVELEEKHNHPFAPPECVHMLPSQREISDIQALQIDLTDDSGVPFPSAHDLLARQAGGRGNLGYTTTDHKNYLRTKRQRALKNGEAGSLLDYFGKRKSEDPSFSFSLQLDVDKLITNIFWADAKMILDYSVFGDVVSFDTTYRTNRNYRPLALFVGMNNHRKMVVFGAALMYDETIESFK